jgi:hypothetical protein
MPHEPQVRGTTPDQILNSSQLPLQTKQPYDAFLVLDVEATCQRGTDFNFPNQIIVSDENSSRFLR